MRWQIIIAAVGLAACLGASQPPGGKTDQELIQGTWQIISEESQGKTTTRQEFTRPVAQLTFKGETWHQDIPKFPASGIFNLETSKIPKHIDFTQIKASKTKEVVYKPEMGIYKLTDDQLIICLNPLGERPNDFRGKEGTLITVTTYQRVKK